MPLPSRFSFSLYPLRRGADYVCSEQKLVFQGLRGRLLGGSWDDGAFAVVLFLIPLVQGS